MTQPDPIPAEVRAMCPAAKDAYQERIAILSEGSPITPEMRQIALGEAYAIDRRENARQLDLILTEAKQRHTKLPIQQEGAD